MRHPEKILEEINKWVENPFNEDFMFKTPIKQLEKFISGEKVDIGVILVSLTSLSSWYASKGVIEIARGNNNYEFICNSFWCDYSYNTMMWMSFEQREKRSKNVVSSILLAFKGQTANAPCISFNDQGLLLAKSLALGLSDMAEIIWSRTLEGLRRGIFYGINDTQLTPFLLDLFSKWKNIPPSCEQLLLKTNEVYKELTLNILNTDQTQLGSCLLLACDFHLSRSGNIDDDQNYEFADDNYAVYPVELLAVFRIRQLLNLNIPQVQHPLLDTPLGKIEGISGCIINPFFQSLLDCFNKAAAS